MRPPSRTRSRHPARVDDRGFSLAEVAVSMAIMSIVTLVIVAATVSVYSGTKRIDNTADARDQLDVSFRRLDRELRYASWLSDDPGPVNGSWYLEFEIPAGCRQLRLSGHSLTLATWNPAGATSGTAVPIASGVSLSNGAEPFTTYAIGDSPYTSAGDGMGPAYELDYEQVRLQFTVTIGAADIPFDSVFTAQNTSSDSATTSKCSKARPT